MTGREDQTKEDEDSGAIAEAGLLGRWIDKGGILFAGGIVVSMLVLLNEVFLRYVFNAPTIWAHETTIFLCGAAFIYGGLYCTVRDRHIRVVLIYDALPDRVHRIFNVIISLICAVSSAFFAWAAYLMVLRAAFRPDGSFRLERSGSAWDPVFPGAIKVFLLGVLVAMALQFLVLAVNYARGKR
ncbi:TRAP transporter small permease subunit [Roseibium sp.]|uniref:TRAP transporter small permease subunit n=1 Tax=Roseibium sp. TaxID=1936156 RepID=UPI003B52FB76